MGKSSVLKWAIALNMVIVLAIAFMVIVGLVIGGQQHAGEIISYVMPNLPPVILMLIVLDFLIVVMEFVLYLSNKLQQVTNQPTQPPPAP